eukprot:gene581-8091_t
MFVSDDALELDYDKLSKYQEVEYYPPEISSKHPNKFDFSGGVKYFTKKIFQTSYKEDLDHLMRQIIIRGRNGNVKCFRLCLDYWEKDFNDETLISLATGLASHELNEVQYLSIKNNSFTDKALEEFGKLLCSFDSTNQSLMYLDVGKRKDTEKIANSLNKCLVARFKRKLGQELMIDLKQTEKIFGEDDPILLDKLNNISSIFWNISLDLDDNYEFEKSIKIECLENALLYCEKAKKLFAKKFFKIHRSFIKNTALCLYGLNDTISLQSISGSDKIFLQNSPQWTKMPSCEEPIKILSLDGGGIRGLALLKMLEEIEKKTNKTIYDSFDMICGTSTGGLISLAIFSKKDNLSKLRDLYYNIGKDIFGAKFKNTFDGLKNLLSSNGWYDISRLEKHMKELYGSDEELYSFPEKKMFVISATQGKKGPPKPFLLKNYVKNENEEKFNCKIWEAARATSAAPTYFSPIHVNGVTFIGKKKKIDLTFMIDGGVVYLNPTEIAYRESCALWPNRDLCIVSLGTGSTDEESEEFKKYNWNVMNTINAMVEEATNAEKTHKTMVETVLSSQMSKKVDYFRLNPPGISDIKLNSSATEELQFMEEITEGYVQAESEKFDKIKEILCPNEIPLIFSTEDLMKIYFEKKPNEEISLFEKLGNLFKPKKVEKFKPEEITPLKNYKRNRTIASCDFCDEKEFKMKKGDEIIIIERNFETGYWKGCLKKNSPVGTFPMNFTESGQAWMWIFKSASKVKSNSDELSEILLKQFSLYFEE